jgi:hypothetical protein
MAPTEGAGAILMKLTIVLNGGHLSPRLVAALFMG